MAHRALQARKFDSLLNVGNARYLRLLVLVVACLPFAGVTSHPGTTALSQDPPKVTELDAVVVQGLVETTIGSYQDLLAGQARFNQLRPSLSPSATLKYALPAGISELYVRHPHMGLVRIPVDANGEFVVPVLQLGPIAAKRQKWPLLARSLKVSEVLPAVSSPRSYAGFRMVGDLRLYCETLWEMQKGKASFSQKMALRMVGGLCGSRRVGFIFPTRRKLAEVEIEGGRKIFTAKISYDRLGFSIPLSDHDLPNSAMVFLKYQD